MRHQVAWVNMAVVLLSRPARTWFLGAVRDGDNPSSTRNFKFTWHAEDRPAILVIGAFLHKWHASEDFSSLFQLLQVFAGEVCARNRGI